MFHHSSKTSGIWPKCKPLRQTTVSLKCHKLLFFFRDINGLMDGGAYTSESGSWSDTLLFVADGGQDMVIIIPPGEGEITSYRGIDVRWAH